MPRPATVPRTRSICQICDSISTKRVPSAKPIIRTRNAANPPPRMRPVASMPRITGQRFLSSAASPPANGTNGSDGVGASGGEHGHARTRAPKTTIHELSSITNMVTYLEKNKSKVFAHRGTPPEEDVVVALRACYLVADYIMDDSVRPQITHMVNELDSTASELLSLDATQSPKAPETPETSASSMSAQFRQLIDKISNTAYAILAHPPVFITPSLLQRYVDVQARLGRPETLPGVFQLYSSKPMPRDGPGPTSYVEQNPNKVANAIEPKVVETALDTAIEARNLDAAVGIIENTYKTKAFIRNKLLRRALLPLGTAAATPLAAYGLATSFSGLQQAMDSATATNVAFAGILAYVGFTASIGVVALTTANDQMERVTWAPGMPLRKRWIREEERAALDKIACAWGFREKWRQGEEEGTDWDALREYIGQRGMVLDRTELMEGME